jgi:uncharacterized membrane protein
LNRRFEQLEREFWRYRREIRERGQAPESRAAAEEPPGAAPPLREEPPVPQWRAETQTPPPRASQPPSPLPDAHRETVPEIASRPPAKDTGRAPSFELQFGTQWLSRIGIVMVLCAIAFFLKYAYDNAWIGPRGRIAIGAMAGLTALGFGERFRRKDWPILFQSFTGGGLAAFYICIFFSFQIYHLAGQSLSMTLAVGVTALAIALAVAHDALALAVLAVLGGFLRPILLSSGTNQPYALFIYVALLDLVAMGAALFRRWRILNGLCFLGSAALYLLWYNRFYGPGQMLPALLFVSIFYMIFLLVPRLNGLVGIHDGGAEGIGLLFLNHILAFGCYYTLLYSDYRNALGYTTLDQAALVLVLWRIWILRLGDDKPTALALLTLGVSLFTLAIPLLFKLYALPIAWAVEAAALTIIGRRSNNTLIRIGAIAPMLLAAASLFPRLPLHKAAFIPILNAPFGSWIVVIAACGVCAWENLRPPHENLENRRTLGSIPLIEGLVLLALLLTLETALFWTLNHPGPDYRVHQRSSLIVLWAILPADLSGLALRLKSEKWLTTGLIAQSIAICFWMAGWNYYRHPAAWPVMNPVFLSRLAPILSLGWAGMVSRRLRQPSLSVCFDLAAHLLLAVLVAVEFWRWGQHSQLLGEKLGVSLVSAAWGVQAFLLIWFGLAKRSRPFRYLGFLLFFLTVGKTLLVDLSEVEKVYRIVSFLASGLLLVAASYFYQRYSSRLMGETKIEE